MRQEGDPGLVLLLPDDGWQKYLLPEDYSVHSMDSMTPNDSRNQNAKNSLRKSSVCNIEMSANMPSPIAMQISSIRLVSVRQIVNVCRMYFCHSSNLPIMMTLSRYISMAVTITRSI